MLDRVCLGGCDHAWRFRGGMLGFSMLDYCDMTGKILACTFWFLVRKMLAIVIGKRRYACTCGGK
jgi:hypothetical protein